MFFIPRHIDSDNWARTVVVMQFCIQHYLLGLTYNLFVRTLSPDSCCVERNNIFTRLFVKKFTVRSPWFLYFWIGQSGFASDKRLFISQKTINWCVKRHYWDGFLEIIQQVRGVCVVFTELLDSKLHNLESSPVASGSLPQGLLPGSSLRGSHLVFALFCLKADEPF